MADNIDMTNDRANIAYLGSRKDVWHEMGQEMKPGQSIPTWAKAAGLEWSAIKVPAIADLRGAHFTHLDADKLLAPVDARVHIVRSDNGFPLGYASDRYQPVQPVETLEWFDRYIKADDRFHLDVAGSLRSGEIIWATAVYRDKLVVGGDDHKARILMTTTFDGTGSTINKGTVTRVVCNNTLDTALGERGCVIRTRHSTKFDGAKVARELAALAKGFEQFKAMGDAMAQVEMRNDAIAKLFKHVLEIPFDLPEVEVSSRKLNQFQALRNSYSATLREGTEGNTVWSALQAVTRFVDHDKDVKRNGESVNVKRFTSAQFGSGAQMKARAVAYLMPQVADRLKVAA